MHGGKYEPREQEGRCASEVEEWPGAGRKGPDIGVGVLNSFFVHMEALGSQMEES